MTIARIADFDAYLNGTAGVSFERHELLPSAESVQRPPAFLLGTVPAALSLPILSEFLTGPVRVYVLRDGRVTADGIPVHGDTALSSAHFNHPDYHIDEVIRAVHHADRPLPVRRIEGRAAMLSGPGYAIYGHWLVDMLPRLWVLQQAGYDIDTLSVIVPTQAPDFVTQLLAVFGIGAERIVRYDQTAEILEVAELLLPTNLRRASRMHDATADARDFLLSRIAVPRQIGNGPDKLFVSRRNAYESRMLVNREAVEAMAVDAGFTLVYPEELSIVEQIDLFAGARQVMGEYGSGLHNTMFSPPGTIVCNLRGTSVYPGFIQSGIGHAFGHHTGYVFGESPLDAIHHSFSVEELFVRTAIRIMALMS